MKQYRFLWLACVLLAKTQPFLGWSVSIFSLRYECNGSDTQLHIFAILDYDDAYRKHLQMIPIEYGRFELRTDCTQSFHLLKGESAGQFY